MRCFTLLLLLLSIHIFIALSSAVAAQTVLVIHGGAGVLTPAEMNAIGPDAGLGLPNAPGQKVDGTNILPALKGQPFTRDAVPDLHIADGWLLAVKPVEIGEREPD